MTPDPAAGPAAGTPTSRSRLVGLDVARGLALVGMIAVHVTPSGGPGDPVPWAYAVAGGRASALFAVLAGCGIALATGGPHPWAGRPLSDARRAVAARAGVVAAVGLTIGGLPTPAAVILAYYGLLFLMALPVLGWGVRRLAVAAAVCAVTTPVVSHLVRRGWPPGPGPNPGWADLVTAPGDLARTLLLDGYYPVLTWSTYLLAGLAVGRLPLASARAALAVVAGGAALAVAGLSIGAATLATAGTAALGRSTGATADEVLRRLATSSYGTSPTSSWWWLGTAGRHSGTTPDLLSTTGTALLTIGAILLLAASADGPGAARGGRTGRRLIAPLVAAGSTTLTLYTLHVLLLGATADWDGLDEVPVRAVIVGHIAVALAVAAIVGAPRRRGPLEAFVAAAVRRAGAPAGSGPGPGRAT